MELKIMKQISTKKRIKLLYKEIQRLQQKKNNDYVSYEDVMKLPFSFKNTIMYRNDVNSLRLEKGEKSCRKLKLLKRLDKAAGKKNSFVFFERISYFVAKNLDAREIPFYQKFKIKQIVEKEYQVFAESEQYAKAGVYFYGKTLIDKKEETILVKD
jgi:hypothetical protein